MARQALAECPELLDSRPCPTRAWPGLTAGVPETAAERTWAELLKRADDVAHQALKARTAELDPHDVINLQYTSAPRASRGATLSRHIILNNGDPDR